MLRHEDFVRMRTASRTLSDRATPFIFGAALLAFGVVAIILHGRSLRASSTAIPGQEVATFELLANLPGTLRETSGVAMSIRHPGIFWTHNDSGHGPHLYAVDLQGNLIARFRVEDAGSNDWEDISRGPCPVSMASEGDCLYVGDTGNNDRDRRRLSVYVVQEPDPTAGSAEAPLDGRVEGARLRYEYPDSRRDSEAIAVTPAGDLLIVNRGRHREINVYVIEADDIDEAIQDGDPVEAESLGPVPFSRDRRVGRVVTGATYAADRSQLIVRTYTGIWALRLTDGVWEEAGSCALGWRERGGEAIDLADDGSFIVTSEGGGGSPATLHRVRCELGN